ncbi:phosphoribosylglycinamide formyltransferase [Phenylobacterium sp. J426]|uniref:phosphoribosylglycinamide formyltransferase n=1 Tax=Phenylobacterium sp. J426 TaxID=2898439 RepID=UPI0021513AC1|nr:phosphoribosylglycinamide formyltransferase [Phenylobacterium sp. J426]
MISRPLKIGFLASGNGSSARAVYDAIQAGRLDADARLLVTNTRKASALEWAQSVGLQTLCVPTVSNPEAADIELADAMAAAGVELIVMSGYLRRLGPATLARYGGRILNIHPGPLPEFGGQGMYGRRVHEAVLASGRAASRIVIHVVDEEYDHGPALGGLDVPIETGDTPETLEERVKSLEPAFFVDTLRRIASGEMELPDGAGS